MEILSNSWVDMSILIFLSYCSTIYSFIELKRTKKKLENSEKYNHTLEVLNDDIRCFRHDFNNMVTTIGGYVTSEDMVGLKKYYTNLECDCKHLNNLSVLSPKLINDPGIYNLLTKKYLKAEQSGIKLSIEAFLDFNKLQMNIYSFTRILGIFLDNAIEAASKTDKKIINIYFRDDKHNNRQLAIIENSYSDKNIDIEEIFKKNKTYKENHSGLGLFEVRKLLKKNNNLNLYTCKDNNFFKQQLEIYYPKS